MVQKKSYSRYFIILQEDEKGYALAKNREPSGYAKLEMKNDKCKISYYVQNLKKDMEPYNMVLICSKKEEKKIINIGMLNLDEEGRADVSFEYASNNIASCRISLDKVVGASIVKMVNTNITAIMTGFNTNNPPQNWKNFTLISPEEERTEQKTTEEDEKTVNDNKNIFDTYEKDIEKIKEKEAIENKETAKAEKKDEDRKAEKSEKIEEVEKVEEVEKIEEVEEVEKVEKVEEVEKDENLKSGDTLKAEMKNRGKKSEKENDKKEDYPSGALGQYFKKLLVGYEEIKDFNEEIKYSKWYKIPINKMQDLYKPYDYAKYSMIYYPMMNYYPYIKKHEYYILGLKCDRAGNLKYIVYAIPGKKTKQDQPYGGKSGFVTWIPENSEKNSENGYWLMFYDFRNSTVVVPVKR